ncbi:MAG TPA: hypothetical protein VNU68_29960 [Verrucomicrobiae bacterium]|nr:hypothetical protein [Verrucomicrobiae bacterium]
MKTPALTDLACRVRQWMTRWLGQASGDVGVGGAAGAAVLEEEFNALALELYAQQLAHNAAYRALSQPQELGTVRHWRLITPVPAAAFKELEMTSLPAGQRTSVFCSSGTTGQTPSRHFHHAESLALYEASLSAWFRVHMLPTNGVMLMSLTPGVAQAPHSSLVHMFETVIRQFGGAGSRFCGEVEPDGTWLVDLAQVEKAFSEAHRINCPVLLLGTAFNYVHLLEEYQGAGRRIALPAGSRVLETGGYKGRVRSRPKQELHAALSETLGVAPAAIVAEYGMSELSSQAYDAVVGEESGPAGTGRVFRFPPWARAEIISPETGRPVTEGDAGLVRIWDLANVWSALAIQTEDLGVRRGAGFELIGRAPRAEPRGCSLLMQ